MNIPLLFWVLFSLILYPVLGIREVKAQTNTPEPEPTSTPWEVIFPTSTDEWEPLIKSQTPNPTDIYTCPDEGEMEHLGTVTPAVEWLMKCGLCINEQTPQPTMVTVEPTNDPSITATPTITPVPDYWMGSTHSAPVGAYDDGIYWKYGILCYTSQDPQMAILGRTDIKREDSFSGTTEDVVNPPDCGVPIHGGSNTRLEEQWKCFHNGDTGACDYACAQVGGCHSYQSGGGFSRSEGTDIMVVIKHYHSRDTGNDFHVIPIYWGYGAPQPTATPMPTGYPSVCDSIIGDDAEGNNYGYGGEGEIGDYFTLPVPEVGSGSCMTMMPEFSIPTTALNVIPGIQIANDLEFPGFTVCAKPITLGSLKMLGFSINLDYYAGIIAGIMMLRKFLRS